MSCLVLIYITNFSTQQEIFPSSTKFSQNFKFGNSRFIFGTETGPEMASPEWRDLDRPGQRMFPNARDGKFSGFFWENPVPGKWHSGTQTSTIYPIKLKHMLPKWRDFFPMLQLYGVFYTTSIHTNSALSEACATRYF